MVHLTMSAFNPRPVLAWVMRNLTSTAMASGRLGQTSPEPTLGLKVKRVTAGDEARTRDPYLGKVVP
jgi:hypothetical protein